MIYLRTIIGNSFIAKASAFMKNGIILNLMSCFSYSGFNFLRNLTNSVKSISSEIETGLETEVVFPMVTTVEVEIVPVGTETISPLANSTILSEIEAESVKIGS